MSASDEDLVLVEVDVRFTRTLEMSGTMNIEVPRSIINDDDELYAYVEGNESWETLGDLESESNFLDTVELLHVHDGDD